MRRHHRHRKRLSGIRLVIFLVCIAVGYAGVLLGIHVIGNRLEKQGETETFGSLEGRFDTDALTYSYGGRTLTYRKRDLTNILVMGVDWADIEEGSSSARYGGQADFLLLLTLDRENRTVSTLQLDRDTMTPVKIYGPFGDYTGKRTEQICLAHAYGDTEADSCRNTVWAVSTLLGGIPIDAYVSLDMESISVLNDALGGITVTLEDDFTQLDPAMAQGATLTLQGKQAEYYVRGRMGIGEGTNLSRMQRQQLFIQAVGDRIVEEMNRDLDFVGMLFDGLSEHMTTNLNRGELINTAYESRAYQRLDTRNLAGRHGVGEDGFMEFWLDEDALGSLLANTFFE